jgi:hypothetical protein
MDKLPSDPLALDMKHCTLVTVLWTGQCTSWCHQNIWASWEAPCRGNVDRKNSLPTLYFVDAQLLARREQKSSFCMIRIDRYQEVPHLDGSGCSITFRAVWCALARLGVHNEPSIGLSDWGDYTPPPSTLEYNTQHHITENSTLHNQCCENLNYNTFIIVSLYPGIK